MGIRENYLNFAKNEYKDIIFDMNSDSVFPDIETGYSEVKIVYNPTYHSLDMKFNGMGNYESIFASYVYPVLMQYREFSVWKMANQRVIRVKIPCINEELGFIEDDAKIQLDYARTLMEILSKIDVARMYDERRIKRGIIFSPSCIKTEIEEFLKYYGSILNSRINEIKELGNDYFGKKGLLYRLSSMSKDIIYMISTFSKYLTDNKEDKDVILLMNYKKETEELVKEIL